MSLFCGWYDNLLSLWFAEEFVHPSADLADMRPSLCDRPFSDRPRVGVSERHKIDRP